MIGAGTPSRRRLGIAAVAILAGGVVLWLLVSNGEGAPGAEEVSEVVPEGVAGGPGPGPGPDELERRRLATVPLDAGTGRGRMGPQMGALEVYRRDSVYPPASRPLSYESHSDLIEWNQRAEYATPLQDDPDVTWIYTADRYFVIGDDGPITSWLDVRRGTQPERVDILEATAEIVARRGPPLSRQPPTVDLDYRWTGQRYENTLSPEVFGDLDRPVQIRMRMRFDHGGDEPKETFINFTYTPANAIAARFTGEFREDVENGSLVVYAGVEVFREGWYNVDVNLFDSRDEPVAWTRYKGDLTRQDTEVPLQFFGKVLVDSQSAPPWTLRQLRGYRYDAETTPPQEAMIPYDGTYTTRDYRLDQFSDARYEPPNRQIIETTLQEEAASGSGVSVPHEGAGTMPGGHGAVEVDEPGAPPPAGP